LINLKELVSSVGKDFRIKTEEIKPIYSERNSDEIFHLPMIAFIILIVANNKKRKLKVENCTGWIIDTMMEMHANFILSDQRLRLSSKLRSKVVEGILFLESIDLINVNEDEEREIYLTEEGKLFLKESSLKLGVSKDLVKKTQNAVSRATARGSVLI
jgi:hypothetical protein